MILFFFFSYTKTGMMVLLSSPHYYTGTEEAKFLAIELPFLTRKCGQLCDNVFSLIVTHFITVCFCSLMSTYGLLD